MRGRPFEAALEAARTFAARKNASEEIGVVTFNSSSQVLSVPTPARGAVGRALAHPPALKRGTHIYDAVGQALTILAGRDVSAGAIVVLSDGGDTGSQSKVDEVIQRARAARVRIFTVGLNSRSFNPQPLETMAEETGGLFHRARSAADLQVIYAGLGTQLANQYVLEYRSQAQPKTSVEVTVRFGDGSTASAQYSAPTPSTIAPFKRSFLERFWLSSASLVVAGLLGAALAAYAVLALLRRPRRTLVRRMGSFVSLPEDTDDGKPRRLLSDRLLSETEQSFSRTRWWASMRNALEISGIAIPPEQVVLGTFVATVLACDRARAHLTDSRRLRLRRCRCSSTARSSGG